MGRQNNIYRHGAGEAPHPPHYTQGPENMVRSALGKVAWVGRTASMVFGLALVLALVFGVASMAFGANGNPFLLGKGNLATAITKLTGNVNGSAMQVANSNAGANDTALSLSVQADEAPMKVNSATRVALLNADKVDGKDSTAFLAENTSHFAPGASSFYYNTTPLTDGVLVGDSTNLRTVTVSCEPGDHPTGGGFADVDPGTTVVSNGRFNNPAGEPSETTNSWRVTWRDDGVAPADELSIQVFCVDLTP